MKFCYRLVCVACVGATLLVLYATWMRLRRVSIAPNEDTELIKRNLIKAFASSKDRSTMRLADHHSYENEFNGLDGVGDAIVDIKTAMLLSGVGSSRFNDVESRSEET